MAPSYAFNAAQTMQLTRLYRLLPASRLAWRCGAAGGQLQREPRAAARGYCAAAAAAAQLDPPAQLLTDLQVDPERPQHGVYGDAPAQPPTPTAAELASSAAGAEQGEAGRTGAFQKLPMVSPAKELLDSALRRAARVGPNKKLKNEAQKARNRAARQLDTLLKELCVPLGRYVKGFPPPAQLHPFERALLELTVGPGTYERVLGRVDALRRSTVQVGKAYAARCSKALNKKDAVALQEEGFERLEAVFAKGMGAVDELKEVAKSLRKLPVVDPELPTVALVGAPNVGKSSLVQLLSSGLPEVQNYPFTTRSIKMGHFYVDGRRHQVTDTPGLLNRKDEERNAMERLTLASLQYLPTAVLFVADLTGECGTTVANQWRIREDLRAKFPGKPWLDVLSKADMLEEEFDAADELSAATPQQQQPGDAAVAPAESSSGNGSSGAAALDPDAAAAGSEETSPAAEPSSSGGSGGGVASAVAFAAALPGALRVSSLTGEGVDELKASMLSMLEEAQLERVGLEAWWDADEDGSEGAGALGDDELIFLDDEDHRQHAELYD